MKLNCKNNNLLCLLACLFLSIGLSAQNTLQIKEYSSVTCGIQQFDKYLPLLAKKKVGIVTNVSGIIGNTTVVDTLLRLKVNVKKIFGPEHGFRGNTEAGEKVISKKDKKTGLPMVT
ncbi:MAG: DUF1343 domain-containing protein [Bacteroidia bacterium]|nr:DUF1343 domain-containing protein [Bacteroidia bacterium]